MFLEAVLEEERDAMVRHIEYLNGVFRRFVDVRAVDGRGRVEEGVMLKEVVLWRGG